MKNIKHSLMFSPRQWRYLKSEAERMGISVSELIRRCIGDARPGFNAPENSVVARLPRA